jgi:nitrogen-specific signal transduction histidine kinase
MPGTAAAVRKAAVAELRSVLAGLRCAATLLRTTEGRASARGLATVLERAAARGERALERLGRGRP